MSATIIDGKAIAAEVRAQVAQDVAAFTARHGRAPGLATILVGEDPASAVYVGGKQKASAEVGITGFRHDLPADATREQVVELIEQLNADPAVSGILCQLPVPDHLDGVELTGLVDPGKDVDGLTPISAGRLALGEPGLRPCTPGGRDDPARAGRRGARGRRGRRDRPLEPLRQADGAAAARARTRRSPSATRAPATCPASAAAPTS